MNANNKLKPCPFCGSTNIGSGEILGREPNGEGYSQTVCYDCGAAGAYGKLRAGEVDYGSEKADAAWNKRSILQAATRDAPSADAVDALKHIKALVCGDRSPRWNNDHQVSISRSMIADIVDKAIAASAPKGDGND